MPEPNETYKDIPETPIWRSQQFYVLLLLLAASRIFLFLTLSYTMDDAFITYRYARNIAGGEGFVYNSGERVQGTSTPLFTLLLAGCAGVVGSDHIPAASRTIAFIADVFSLGILWGLLSAAGGPARFVTCILFAMYPKIVLVSISGMETPLVVFLMLLSYLLLFEGKRTGLAFLVFGLLLLCRIDGIVWILACLWRAGWERMKGARWSAVGSASIPIAWLIFSQLYFGSWVPHSLVAKSVSYAHEFPWFDPVRVLVGYFPFEGLKGQSFVVQSIAVCALLVPVIIELIHLIRMKSTLAVFPIFFLAYNLAFSLGRTIVVDWYYFPGYIAYFVCVGSLIDSVLENARKKSGAMYVSLGTSLVVLLMVLLGFGASRWSRSLTSLYVHQNMALGTWLKTHANRSAQVLVEPIGYIGWISEAYVHDYIGLTSSSVIAVRRRHPGSDAWFLEYVQERRPDYIVLRDWEMPTNRLFHGFGDGIFRGETERAWFTMNYDQTQWNPGDTWTGPGPLVLYRKVGDWKNGGVQ